MAVSGSDEVADGADPGGDRFGVGGVCESGGLLPEGGLLGLARLGVDPDFLGDLPNLDGAPGKFASLERGGGSVGGCGDSRGAEPLEKRVALHYAFWSGVRNRFDGLGHNSVLSTIGGLTRKVFISYHHANDQKYKNYLSAFGVANGCFVDGSVCVGDIDDDDRSSESIRRIIRDEYLQDSEVTILLCGSETKGRKHIDWELKSSMIDGDRNQRSGILVVNLPEAGTSWFTAGLPGEIEAIYPSHSQGWQSVDSETGYRHLYPRMPDRIIDNLLKAEVFLSVVPWVKIADNADALVWLVEQTAQIGSNNEYDLSRKMRRANSSSGSSGA